MSDEPKILFCGVRDGGDFWHLECRFDDGQKFAAVQVDKAHERLADEIAAYLNTGKLDDGLATIRIEHLDKQLASCEGVLRQVSAKALRLEDLRDAYQMRVEQLEAETASLRQAVANLTSEKETLGRDYGEAVAAREELRRIVWGLVHNAGRCLTSGRVERWAAVMEAVGCGSTQAHELCRQHGLDPDELVGRGDLCGGCEEDGGTCGGCICDDAVSQHCTRSDEDLGGHGCECERRRVAQLEAELQELSAVRDQLEACPFCAVPRCAARCQLLG